MIFIVVLVSSSLVMVGDSVASSKPSAPHFTLQYVKHPYDTPPQYTTDPYTGKSVISSGGYHYENASIEVTIKNPPFTSYVDSSGNKTGVFYSFRFKGHYSPEWKEYEDCYSDSSCDPSDYMLHHYGFFNSSNGDYTVAALRQIVLGQLPADAEVDIQIKTLVGYIYQKYYATYMGDGYYPVFVGEESQWSSTQTVKLSDGTSITQPTAEPTADSPPTQTPTATPLPTPTATATTPDTQTLVLPDLHWEQAAILVLTGAVAVMAVGMVLLWRRVPRK
jgi:hypothetical protein